MRRTRREFLRASSIVAAGAAVACGPPTASARATGSPPSSASTFSLSVQFSGLLIHGSWPVKSAANPAVLSGWDALLVRDGRHAARLRMPLANVVNPTGYSEDRYLPGVGVWDLTNQDLIIDLDGRTRGDVTAETKTRPNDASGMPVACPRPGYPDDFRDITWLADFYNVLGDGALKDDLKADSDRIKRDDLLNARVRLSTGDIACAKPSLPEFEVIKFGFSDTSYKEQFLADLVRFKSADAQKIVVKMIPFGGTAVSNTLELVPVAAQTTVWAFLENYDPHLIDRALDGTLSRANYWDCHFAPYYHLLKYKGYQVKPLPTCCTASCDPPFYCFSPRGYFA